MIERLLLFGYFLSKVNLDAKRSSKKKDFLFEPSMLYSENISEVFVRKLKDEIIQVRKRKVCLAGEGSRPLF